MNNAPLYITSEDNARLRLLLAAAPDTARNPAFRQLQIELERAEILDASTAPAAVVRMGSQVEIEDLATGEVESYTLVFPEQADIGQKRLSVLTPIGTALIGCAEGTTVDWQTPGGVRRFKIHRVTRPDERTTTVPAATLEQILGRTA